MVKLKGPYTGRRLSLVIYYYRPNCSVLGTILIIIIRSSSSSSSSSSS